MDWINPDWIDLNTDLDIGPEGWGYIKAGILVLLLMFASSSITYGIPYIRQWGASRRMRKEEEERQRILMSACIRYFIECQVSAEQLSRTDADEWYRRFSRLRIPDLLPPMDYLKEQIRQRLKAKSKKPIRFPDLINWATYKPKEVKPKKQLIQT